jgi:hypothetical protein
MAITIDRLTNIISVPLTEWALVSGTFYTHDTEAFRVSLKIIEASEEGMVFTDTNKRNAPVTVAGTTLAQSIEIIPPYSVEYESGAYSVQLVGSNNNIWSIGDGILVQNQTQVIPTNSAGLIITGGGGGGATAQEVWEYPTSSLSGDETTMGYWVTRKLLSVVKYLGLKKHD